MRADGTVLDFIPVGRVLIISGVLLVILFTLIKPEASNGLGLTGRLLFWTMHVGLGLGALWLAGRWLASGNLLPGSALPAVLLTGVAAILIAAPGYLMLDALFEGYTIDLDPDPPISWPLRLAVEVGELAPWFMLTWLIINLPVLLPPPTPTISTDDSVGPIRESTSSDQPDSDTDAADAISGQTDPEGQKLYTGESRNEIAVETGLTAQERRQTFLLNLPGVVGTDIVAVSSDLHYLNVWTVAGRSTVLGNLRDVAVDLDDLGMQVHRSHWVAHAHVRRIVGTASSASCILSNELRIPISRRRWKTVRQHYGRGVVHTTISSENN